MLFLGARSGCFDGYIDTGSPVGKEIVTVLFFQTKSKILIGKREI